MPGRLLDIFGRVTDAVAKVTMALLAGAFVVVVILNGWEAVARFFFGASSLYLVEFSLALAAIVYFLGYAVLLKDDEDVRMGYFVERMSPSARRVVDVLTETGVLVFFIVLFRAALSYHHLSSLMAHPVFPFPQSYTVLPIVIGAGACLWVALYRFLVALDRLIRRSGTEGAGAADRAS